MRVKKTGADYMMRWRAYVAEHGCVPVENAKNAHSESYRLAMEIRTAKSRGKFSPAELRELESAPHHKSRPSGDELIAEWRAYIAKHNRVPVQTRANKLTARYQIAKRIKKAKAAGVFTPAQMRELTCPPRNCVMLGRPKKVHHDG